MINMETIKLVKPGAYLINCARGPICKEDALVYGLEKGILAGCALDVFEIEPLPDSSRLYEFADKIFMAPHNSNQSPLAHERVHWNAIRNVLKVLNVEHVDEMVDVDFSAYDKLTYDDESGKGSEGMFAKSLIVGVGVVLPWVIGKYVM